MRHVVKKQIIELTVDSRENIFQIQNDISRFYWNNIVPELEKIFDQVSGDKNFYHQLDKLEIELGTLNQNVLSSSQNLVDICPGIISKIKEEIQLRLNNRHSDGATAIAAQWLHYMEKGFLNWNTLLVEESWDQKVLESFATNYATVSSLRKLISKNQKALERISIRHNEVFLSRLTEVLTAEKQDQLLQLVNELCEFLKQMSVSQESLIDANPPRIRKKIWEKIISIAAGGKKKLTTAEIASDVINWLGKDGSESLLKRNAKKNHYPYLRQITKQNGSNKDKKKVSDPRKTASKIIKNDILKNIPDQKKDHSVQTDIEIPEDGIFVHNAGIVLLHPFFALLFNKLKLTNKALFVDEASRQKSLYIMHYLATGKEEPEEHELVVPKFLNGYPLEDVIYPAILSDEEKEEADYLLEAAIEKWSILGNTSPSALRESFLQRKGKLYAKNKSNFLQVETSSIDVLLDHLPWNLSIIKLPWMKEMLRVEWS